MKNGPSDDCSELGTRWLMESIPSHKMTTRTKVMWVQEQRQKKKNRRGRKARAKRRDAAAARATLRLRISIFRIRNVLSRSQQTQTHTQLPPFNIKNSLSTTFGQKVSSCDGCSDKIGLDCFGLWASPQKAPGMWGETRNKLGPSASLLPEGLGKGPTVLNRFHRFFGHKSIRKTVFSSG